MFPGILDMENADRPHFFFFKRAQKIELSILISLINV